MSSAAVLGGIFATWVNSSTFHAQHLCSRSANSCRTVAHGVFVIGPEFGDGLLDKLKVTGLDAHSGEEIGYTNWENHVVNGVCQGTTFAKTTAGRNCTAFAGGVGRVYNWGYEHIGQFQPATLPESISVQIQISGASGQYFMMPAVTIPYEKHIVTGKQNSKEILLDYNEFSSVAFQDGDDTLLHAVFSVAPVDDPTENLTTTGEYSIDGGKSWQTNRSIDHILFENHIDDKNGTFFQSFQYDVRYKKYLLNQMLCFRIAVADSRSGVQYQKCLKVCDNLVPFHNPLGYCPNSTVLI